MKVELYDVIIMLLLSVAVVVNVHYAKTNLEMTRKGWNAMQENLERSRSNTRDVYGWLTSDYCDSYAVMHYCPEYISIEAVQLDPLLLNYCEPIKWEGTYPEVCE